MKVLEKTTTTIGAFRVLRMSKDGSVALGTGAVARAVAEGLVQTMAKDNPGALIEVVEVDQAFRSAVVVMEIEGMK